MKPRQLLAAVLVACALPAGAQEIQEIRVQFAPGTSSASVAGEIEGYETIDYLLGAAEGQYATVSMTSGNLQAYFNVLPPGSDGEVIHFGNIAGNQFEGLLPASGDYRVRVYLMRAAARRGETASFQLDMAIMARAAPSGPGSAKRAGQSDFDATVRIPCAQAAGQPMGQCDFGVARGPGGRGDGGRDETGRAHAGAVLRGRRIPGG